MVCGICAGLWIMWVIGGGSDSKVCMYSRDTSEIKATLWCYNVIPIKRSRWSGIEGC